MRATISRILTSLPAFLVAAGFGLYVITTDGLAPRSLREALSHTAFCYTLGMVAASAACGLLALFDNRILAVRAELIMRLIMATALAGFTTGVLLGPTLSWGYAGLAAAATIEALARWWQIRTVTLPVLIITTREQLK